MEEEIAILEEKAVEILLNISSSDDELGSQKTLSKTTTMPDPATWSTSSLPSWFTPAPDLWSMPALWQTQTSWSVPTTPQKIDYEPPNYMGSRTKRGIERTDGTRTDESTELAKKTSVYNRTEKRPRRTKEELSILRGWVERRMTDPPDPEKKYLFPTVEEKQELMQQTGLSFTQINNWFTNARRRYY